MVRISNSRLELEQGALMKRFALLDMSLAEAHVAQGVEYAAGPREKRSGM